MKERPSEGNTPRCNVRETHELPYETFEGSLEHVKSYLDKLIKDNRWEGIEVLNVFWNRGAVYQVYRHRPENDIEYGNRLRRLQEKYDNKLKQLKELQEELET